MLQHQQHLFRHHKSRQLIAAPPVPETNPVSFKGESSSEAVMLAGSLYPIQELKNQHGHHQFQQSNNFQTSSHKSQNSERVTLQSTQKRGGDRFQQPVKGTQNQINWVFRPYFLHGKNHSLDFQGFWRKLCKIQK